MHVDMYLSAVRSSSSSSQSVLQGTARLSSPLIRSVEFVRVSLSGWMWSRWVLLGTWESVGVGGFCGERLASQDKVGGCSG